MPESRRVPADSAFSCPIRSSSTPPSILITLLIRPIRSTSFLALVSLPAFHSSKKASLIVPVWQPRSFRSDQAGSLTTVKGTLPTPGAAPLHRGFPSPPAWRSQGPLHWAPDSCVERASLFSVSKNTILVILKSNNRYIIFI